MVSLNFFKKIAGALLLLAITISLFSPFIVLAKRLEVTYPGETGKVPVSTRMPIGEYIKYIFHLVIIAAIFIAVGVLIYGGVMYVSSSGNANQMKEARSWIFSAFLGLTILLGAFLVLNTINPQLITIKKPPSGGTSGPPGLGIYLYHGTNQNPRYVGTSIADLEAKFPGFIPNRYEIIDNAGADRDKIEVIAYSEKNFQGESNILKEKDCELYDGEDHCSLPSTTTKSIIINLTGPGVYVYSGGPDEVKNYTGSAEQINGGKVVRIQNGSDNDYLAIFYEDPYYRGQLRAFFRKKAVRQDGNGGTIDNSGNLDEFKPGPVTKISTTAGPISTGSQVLVEDVSNFVKEDEDKNDNYNYIYVDGRNNDKSSFWRKIINISSDPKILYCDSSVPKYKQGESVFGYDAQHYIGRKGKYGKIKNPSSIRIFQMGPPSNCQEVTLCTLPNYQGNCIYFNLSGDKNDTPEATSGDAVLPLSSIFYNPYNLKDINEDINGDSISSDTFEDNIRSIKIIGDCAVILFENQTKPGPDFWSSGGPGANSQAFTKSEWKLNQAGNPICRETWDAIRFSRAYRCSASAIAIFPLKKIAPHGAGGSW